MQLVRGKYTVKIS